MTRSEAVLMELERYDLEKQHRKEKLHAIERIFAIVDENTFQEIKSDVSHIEMGLNGKSFGMGDSKTPYDGVITGFGEVHGKQVCVYAQDFTVMGGSIGERHGKKIAELVQMAIRCRCPLIGINDSGGARIHEGMRSLVGTGEMLYYNSMASGYIPQFIICAGPCAGGSVYSAALSDFVYVIDDVTTMSLTGFRVVKNVLNQQVTNQDLGGADVHANFSGVAHFRHGSEAQCFEHLRGLIDMLPHHNQDRTPIAMTPGVNKDLRDMDHVLPLFNNRPYDVRKIITRVFDDHSFIEVQESFAANLVVGFARLSNGLVGIVANQPDCLSGAIECNASDKAARFIRFCDAFNIPLVTFTDTPGFMPGMDEERKGIIRHGAKLVYAYSEATVPKINIILRKAFGGAYIAMSSKHVGADFVFAWPSAEIAVVGASGAVEVLFHKQIESLSGDELTEFRQKKIDEYHYNFSNPKFAAEAGYVDEIISPAQTRSTIIKAMKILQNKYESPVVIKKHNCMPM